MADNIVDSLIVTLRLDDRQFKDDVRSAESTLDDVVDSTERANKSLSDSAVGVSDAASSAASTAERHAQSTADTVEKLAESARQSAAEVSGTAAEISGSLSESTTTLSTSASNAASEVGGIGTAASSSLKAVLGLAGGILTIGAAITGLITKTVGGISKVGSQSYGIGIDPRRLDALQRASEVTPGGSAEGVTQNLSRIADQIASYRAGNGIDEGFGQALGRLGVLTGNPDDLAKNPETIYFDFIKALQQFDPTIARQYAEQAGFNSGEILAVLQEGVGRYQGTYQQKYQSSNMTPQGLEESREFLRVLGEANDAFSMLSQTIGLTLLPIVTAVTKEIGKWAKNPTNRGEEIFDATGELLGIDKVLGPKTKKKVEDTAPLASDPLLKEGAGFWGNLKNWVTAVPREDASNLSIPPHTGHAANIAGYVGAAPQGQNITNNNKTDIHINSVNIETRATNAKEIGREINNSLRDTTSAWIYDGGAR